MEIKLLESEKDWNTYLLENKLVCIEYIPKEYPCIVFTWEEQSPLGLKYTKLDFMYKEEAEFLFID